MSVKGDKRSVAFFYKHAGYCYFPGKSKRAGRSRCAKELADAEAEALARGWFVEWERDEDPDLSWATEEEQANVREVLCAVLYDEHRNVLASLCGIVDPSDAYARVVEAELADEALSASR